MLQAEDFYSLNEEVAAAAAKAGEGGSGGDGSEGEEVTALSSSYLPSYEEGVRW